MSPNNEDGTFVENSDRVVDEVTETPVVETPEVKSDKVDPKTFTEEYVKELRAEAAANRVEKQKERAEKEALLAQLKEFQDAQLSAEEKMSRDFDEARTKASSLENKAQDLTLKYELAMAAREENISDVKAAVKLADRELIEYDSAGNIANMADVIENLRTTYPSLFSKSASAPNTGVTNPAKPPAQKKYTREDLKGLSAEKRVELMESGALNHLLGRK